MCVMKKIAGDVWQLGKHRCSDFGMTVSRNEDCEPRGRNEGLDEFPSPAHGPRAGQDAGVRDHTQKFV